MDKRCKEEIRQILEDRTILKDGLPGEVLALIQDAVHDDRIRRMEREMQRRKIQQELQDEERRKIDQGMTDNYRMITVRKLTMKIPTTQKVTKATVKKMANQFIDQLNAGLRNWAGELSNATIFPDHEDAEFELEEKD